jgi:hypothetical protein
MIGVSRAVSAVSTYWRIRRVMNWGWATSIRTRQGQAFLLGLPEDDLDGVPLLHRGEPLDLEHRQGHIIASSTLILRGVIVIFPGRASK